jgi:hypothetical protein
MVGRYGRICKTNSICAFTHRFEPTLIIPLTNYVQVDILIHMSNQVDIHEIGKRHPLLLITTVGEICQMFDEPRHVVKWLLRSGKFDAMQSSTIWLIWLPSVIQHFGRMPSHWPARFDIDVDDPEAGE